MKTFADLEFHPHPAGNGKQGLAFFPNGYGISVVRFASVFGGYGSYTSDETEWEAAVLKGPEMGWSICYTTPVTDDVEGHLSEADVTEMMRKIQELPSAELSKPAGEGRE